MSVAGDGHDLIEVARYSTLPEAELAVALLRKHGVAALLPDRETANTLPHMQIAFGGLRVLAPEAQVAEARDILHRAAQGDLAEDDSDDDGDWRSEATPGRVGELDEAEVHGVLGSMKGCMKVLIAAFLLLPVAGCVLLNLFG